MSAMHDYFRAPDRATATWRPDELRAPARPLPDAPVFDVVETKWVDPTFCIRDLVAAVKGVPSDSEEVELVTLYPPPEGAPKSEEEWLALPEESPSRAGPETVELPVGVRAVLAGVADARLPGVARRWAEENPFALDEGYALELAGELVGLARRAREAGELLYCWWIPG